MFHGNLSSSNVLLTSDSVAYLTDFAPYKPLYLNESKLEEVKLFHPNVLDKCYLAPEKLDSEKASTFAYPDYSKINAEDLQRAQSMDVFSIGCILAEIFADLSALFRYETMLSYKTGDKSQTDKLQSIENEHLRGMVTKMIQLDPKERGTLKGHLQTFTNCMPKDMLDLYGFFNYVLRRGEFSQPDNKLGLIRLMAPIFIQVISQNTNDSNKSVVEERLKGLAFRRCFPYHISKVAILCQLKGIIESCPVKALFSKDNTIKYIDETMAYISRTDFCINSGNEASSIYLDSVQHLKESKLDIHQKPYLAENPFADESHSRSFDVRETFESILVNAKASMQETTSLQMFTVLSHIVETICSLVRNLQLSQSYLVALELLENFTRFIRSEQVILLVFPHLTTQIKQQANKIEVYYSINLFCKLVKRIRYVPKSLGKQLGLQRLHQEPDRHLQGRPEPEEPDLPQHPQLHLPEYHLHDPQHAE